MKRIQVPKTELDWLREKLFEKYKTIEAAPLIPNSYLGQYEKLNRLIKASIDHKRDAAISRNVLRKLFYEAKDLESSIFNKDYLNALYYFLTDGKLNRAQYIQQNRVEHSQKKEGFTKLNWSAFRSFSILFFSTIFLLVFLIDFNLFTENGVKEFYEDFQNIDSKRLLDGKWNGWKIVDIDSSFLSKQLNNDALTLYTLEGDNWGDVRFDEKPIIKNLFLKKLNCKECEIYLTINNFIPNQPWQQTGIMVYDKKGKSYDPSKFVRFTYAYHANARDPVNGRQGKGIQIIEKLGDEIISFSKTIRFEDIRFKSNFNSMTLKIRINNDSYGFWLSEDGIRYRNIINDLPRNVEPEYLGIGAFQGFTDFYGNPINADSIPVFIDRVGVVPL